jgi:hypothetical protein
VVTFFGSRAPDHLRRFRPRLVYAIVEGRLTRHNTTAQILAEGGGQGRFVSSADLRCGELAPAIDAMMTNGVDAMKKALEATA